LLEYIFGSWIGRIEICFTDSYIIYLVHCLLPYIYGLVIVEYRIWFVPFRFSRIGVIDFQKLLRVKLKALYIQDRMHFIVELILFFVV
jgi:hypothetical protein